MKCLVGWSGISTGNLSVDGQPPLPPEPRSLLKVSAGAFQALSVVDSHRVNHVVHKFVNFGPLEPRLSPVPHDFRISPWILISQISSWTILGYGIPVKKSTSDITSKNQRLVCFLFP